jgi:hypothetical protein
MLLAIYLNDHLAGATAGRELARRAAASNRGSSYAPFLLELADQIEHDRGSLLEIMRALEVKTDPLKLLGGWTAEKFGRLKLNGRLLGYSPLSRVIELEALALGVAGKLALWRALQRLQPDHPALVAHGLPDLIARAARQLEELEAHRMRAVDEAFHSAS